MNRPYDGIDTAGTLSPAKCEKLREAGISFVVRYLVPNEGATAWKALTAKEADVIRAAGLAIMLCWETTASRVKGGASAGAEDGKKTRELAEGMGIPVGAVIYFAADYNVPASDYEAVDAYIRAARIALGKYSAGLYGHEKICDHVSGHCTHLWQCVAWSNEFIDAADVIQYEWQGGANAKALAERVGVLVDLDAAVSLDGMWLPATYADGGDVTYTQPQTQTPSTETSDALKWAKSVGIYTDDMKDVTQTAVMLYRYNRIIMPEDNKKYSGLLE